MTTDPLQALVAKWRADDDCSALQYAERLYCAQDLEAALSQARVVGWVIADGQGARWRCWGDSGPEWTPDRDRALQFARRDDAEAFARDDEDSWLIHPVTMLAAAPAARGTLVETPRQMSAAPRDGTMLRLLVDFDDHATEDSHDPSWTIGANNCDYDGEDQWKFAGWCWSHDHFTQGTGKPVGWLPMLSEVAAPAMAVDEPTLDNAWIAFQDAGGGRQPCRATLRAALLAAKRFEGSRG